MEVWLVMFIGKKMIRIKLLKIKMVNLKWMMMLLLK